MTDRIEQGDDGLPVFLFEPVTSFEDDAAKYRRELFYDNVWALRVTRPAQFIVTDCS